MINTKLLFGFYGSIAPRRCTPQLMVLTSPKMMHNLLLVKMGKASFEKRNGIDLEIC